MGVCGRGRAPGARPALSGKPQDPILHNARIMSEVCMSLYSVA